MLLLFFYATVLPSILTQLCQSNGFYAETSQYSNRYNMFRMLTVSIGLLFTLFILNKPSDGIWIELATEYFKPHVDVVSSGKCVYL